MGLLSDLKMGLGLQERDADYYERTARTLGRTQGAGREAQYRQSRAFTEQPAQAGLLSRFANSDRSNRRFGDTDASGNRVGALRDMFDGGGAGRSGQQFEGGLLAMFANALGIKPLGYQQSIPSPAPSATTTVKPSAVETSLRPKNRPGRIGMNDPQEIMDERMVRRLSQLPRPFAMGDWGSPVNMPMGPVRSAGDPLITALTSAPAQPSQGNMGSLPTRGSLLTTLPAAAATYQPSTLQPIGPSYDYTPRGAYYNPMTIPGTGMQDALNYALSQFGKL